MSLPEVRQALGDYYQEAREDLNVYNEANSVTQVPAVVINPSNEPTIDFNVSFSKTAAAYYFDVVILTAKTELVSNQQTLDALLDLKDPLSIVSLTKNARTLGGVAMTVRPVRVDNYGGQWSAANIDHIGALLRVEITTC